MMLVIFWFLMWAYADESASPQQSFCTYTEQGNKCSWLGAVSIQAANDGATFQLNGSVDQDAQIPLVGSTGAWPIEVRDNGQIVPVIEKNGIPYVQVQAGTHQVTGTISWPRIPSTLKVPVNTGIITLQINGKKVENPKFQPDAGLIFDTSEKQDISVQIIRKITDGVPILIETHILLRATGELHTVNLGPVDIEGTYSREIVSQLPSWRDESGNLLIQVDEG